MRLPATRVSHSPSVALAFRSAFRYNLMTPMITIEIPQNPNCAAVDTRVFHDLAPPCQVNQVRLEHQAGRVQWYDITGWTTAGTPCPAVIQKVDDSGEGVAFLIYGGDAGLRLKLAGHNTPWQFGDPEQWGEPFLLVTDLNDVLLVHPSDRQRTVGSVVHG